MVGMHTRMGQHMVQDLALSLDVIIELLRLIEEAFVLETTPMHKRALLFAGSFVIFAFLAAFRGYEVPMIDLTALQESIRTETSAEYCLPHVVLALVGRIKIVKGKTLHLQYIAAKNKSGLEPIKWAKWLLDWHDKEKCTKGWAFCRPNGKPTQANDINDVIDEKLMYIQESHPDLLSLSIDVVNEVDSLCTWR